MSHQGKPSASHSHRRYPSAKNARACSGRARERLDTRRPIKAAEIPHLEALGARLRELRRGRAGLSQERLAERAELSAGTIGRIEAGTRRTRFSTLERIAAALTDADPSLGESESLAVSLAGLAGPALAPESEYAERVERRRKRRWRKRRNRQEAGVQRQALAALNELRRWNRAQPEYAGYRHYGDYDEWD